MIRNRKVRRAGGAALILLGVLAMWLAPEVWWGALLFGAGIVLEIVGLMLERPAADGDRPPR